MFIKLLTVQEEVGIEYIAFRGYTKTSPLAAAIDNDVISLSSHINTGDEVYVVDKYMAGVKRTGKIMSSRTTKDLSGVEYLVQFKGWSERWNEWINEDSNRLFKIPPPLMEKDGQSSVRSSLPPATAISKETNYDHAWSKFISPLKDRFKANQGKSPFDLVSIVSSKSLSATCHTLK